jgi:beta-glucosidase/6-phospho-beta-glucosidase/beta-galactosidase
MFVSLSLLVAAASATVGLAIVTPLPPSILNGKVFPSNFIFGTSTSAYQVEGGWLDGGKGLSNWDAFSHTPGQISHGDTGDIANDMYHLYPEDIQLMKQYGLKHYRFSISWNRILPTGVLPVSQDALDYYNDLINQLLSNGIEPHVTIFHNDIPLALMMYPHGPQPFLDYENFPTWYTDYAEVLFENFGDRVTHWFTFNEPFCTAVFGPIGDSVRPVPSPLLSPLLLCISSCTYPSPLSLLSLGPLSDRS